MITQKKLKKTVTQETRPLNAKKSNRWPGSNSVCCNKKLNDNRLYRRTNINIAPK